MGRTPNEINVDKLMPQNPPTREEAAEFQRTQRDGAALAALAAVVTEDQVQLSEMVGAIKMAMVHETLLTVSRLKMLSEIKESKKYKDLAVRDPDGKLRHVRTWADFCVAMGVSFQHLDEELKNLAALGEQFLESSKSLGIGYRQLRALRKLPDDERQLVIEGEAVKTGDREALVDLIEDLVAKHAKEKAALKDLRETYDAQGRVMADLEKTKNELRVKLTRAERKRLAEIDSASPDETLKDILLQVDSRAFQARVAVEELRKAVDAAMAHTSAHGGDVTELLSGHLAQLVRDIGGIREAHLLKAAPDGLTEDEQLRRQVAEWNQ